PPDAAALAARLAKLAATANHVALHVGAAFSAATDAARLRMPLGGDLIDPGVSAAEALEAARPLLAAKAPKALYDVKALGALLPETAGDAFDTMLAAYVLDPQRPSFDLQALCESAGTPWDAACPAASLWPLRAWQEEKLASDELTAIYRDIERPLAGVLYAMEREGFLIDADALEALGRDFRARAAELEAQIYALAGETFNIKSPKQLSEVLFDKLGLPRPRKTNRGFATTSAEVLESLSGDYPICALILDYRRYQKLDSTYVGALIKLRDENGRVHSSFDQTATATGRISSNEPNLQNIPVRTEVGREIRAAFVARPGWVLVDADYSQIELRVLAHMSGDETMRSAFLEGQDIHSRTAAEVYGVPLDAVTPAMRSSAKAVNFGIVYGISDFTLAKNISVSRAEARNFMERYFARYPGVKRFMDEAVRLGHERGYARTLLGRRRYLPELKSGNYNVRAFGERCAMNSPIQGTAADIIKLAMIRVFEALRAQDLRARLILQVHDELIVEAPEDEAGRVRALLQECMEGVMRLSVPLRTDISVGRNWRECK
ncbi:MAG TPA: DNA polymerase I, partial [Candidatus Pullichristensenella stercoripullorum]|nr:DNA polymerase I [Candidatus Pullichristensenella stercoripullorum]